MRAFPFETPIASEALIDRRDELHQLHLAAVDGAHVRVAGPRRYGKTSLLLAHAHDLRETGWRTVHVDFYGVTSLVEVCGRIATAYGRLRDNSVRNQLTALGSRLGLSLGTSGVSLTLGPRAYEQPSHDTTLAAAAELLDLPMTLYEKDRIKTLVVFDEFQDLLSAGATLDGLLRSHVQYHGDAATYVYAGSQPSMMRRLFTDRERPLYGQAEPLELAPLPIDEVLDELGARFAALDRDPGETLAPLVAAAAGHPQRTMLLAHLLHRELELRDTGGTTLRAGPIDDLDPDGEQPTPPAGPPPEGVALADALLDLALTQTDEAHHAVWDQLSAGKKAVLAALADGVRPTGSRATERSGLSRAALQSALRDLVREGQHVSRVVTGPPRSPNWRFVDPLFAGWVRHRGQPR